MRCLAVAIVAFGLGWFAVPELARELLERRGDYRISDAGALLYPGSATTLPRPLAMPLVKERILSATALAVMAVLCQTILDPLPSSLALAGFAIMETACICDTRARIIPWELCLVLFVLAVPFRLAVSSATELLQSTYLALGILFTLMLCNIASRAFRSSQAIGFGDMRLVPALCLFGGIEGSLVGMFVCALFMGGYALLALAMKWATPRSGIPLAPGLALWFAIGTFGPALF